MRIDTSGKVFVGFDNAAYANGDLVVGKGTASGNSTLGIQSNGSANLNKINFGDGSRGDRASIISGATNYLAFSTFDGSSTTQERMRIDSSGNVGIGTDSPAAKLEVYAGTGNSFRVIRDSDNLVEIGNYNSTDGYRDTAYGSSQHIFYNAAAGAGGGSEAMRIDSSGNVGIGTSSPTEDLHVSGTADQTIAVESTSTGAGANAGIKILAADGGDFLWQTGNATGNALRLYDLNASLERMRIDSSGHAIIPAGVTLGTAAGVYAAANTLDDYEEGTWSPEIYEAGSLVSVNSGGWYRIIGNTLILHGYAGGGAYGVTAFPVSSGSATIGNFPFAIPVGFSGRNRWGTISFHNGNGGTDRNELAPPNSSGTFTYANVLRSGDGDYGGWVVTRGWSSFNTDTNCYVTFDLVVDL
jgi:hypothetical protein